MNATTPMTAADLYQTDTTFRRAIDEWVENRRCDLRLVDYLIELDMVSQAEACRWAATERERDVMLPIAEEHGERGGSCGPFPACNRVPRNWVWCPIIRPGESNGSNAFDVPADIDDTLFRKHDTPALAILWLLDNWHAREGSK